MASTLDPLGTSVSIKTQSEENGVEAPAWDGIRATHLRNEVVQVLEAQHVQLRSWIHRRLEAHKRCLETVVAQHDQNFRTTLDTLVEQERERSVNFVSSATPFVQCPGGTEAPTAQMPRRHSSESVASMQFLRSTPRRRFVPLEKPPWQDEMREVGSDKSWTRPAQLRESFNNLREEERNSQPLKVAWRLMATNSHCGIPQKLHLRPLWALPRLRAFVGSKGFRGLVDVLIVLSAILTAVETDANVKTALHAYDTWGDASDANPHGIPQWVQYLETPLLWFFVVEVFLRITAYQHLYFFGFGWRCNLFDFFVVLASLVVWIANGDDTVSYIRVFRLLRALRALRVIQVVRSFRALKVMLISIMNSMMPLVWTLVFLAMVIFIAAIVFSQGVADYIGKLDTERSHPLEINQSGPPPGRNPADEIAIIKLHLNTFSGVFLVLMQSVAAGIDWWEVHHLFRSMSPFWGNLFVLYQGAMTFGILNIITGLFVENALHISKMDRDLAAQEEIERSVSLMTDLRGLFKEMDKDKNDSISIEEFEEKINCEEVQAYFRRLGLDTSDAKDLFKVLDVDGSTSVEIDEFVMGCIRLMGSARTVNVVTLIYEQRMLIARVAEGMNSIYDYLNTFENTITSILSDSTKAGSGDGAETLDVGVATPSSSLRENGSAMVVEAEQAWPSQAANLSRNITL